MSPDILVCPAAERDTALQAEPQSRNPGVACVVLMPHAPILVPDVGGARGKAAIASQHAMSAAAACVVSHQPETVVLISPHSPRHPQAFGVWADDPVQGSFAQFDAPQIELCPPLDQPLARAIMAAARARGLETWRIRRCLLDHGALVPLWFLAGAGWAGPVVVLSLNHYPDCDMLTALGEAIAEAARTLPRRIAIVASGDMSHRLTTAAPCGYHRQAHKFDEIFIHRIRAGDFRRLAEIPHELRELAAEDAVDSTLVAAAAVNWRTAGHQVLNYESPFGVGYGVGVLFAEPQPSPVADVAAVVDKNDGNLLPALARRAVVTDLSGSYEPPPAPPGEYLGASHGVFVTIRQRGGQLRGCIGTCVPVCPNIVAETWRVARLAALQDHRFIPVTLAELPGLRFEVSVLHPLEEVTSEAQLDPRRYGVVVSAADGRQGLLLPGITEIKTAEEQLQIARRKGLIKPGEPVTVQRFQVDCFKEPL